MNLLIDCRIQRQSFPAAGHVHAKTGTFQLHDPLNHRLVGDDPAKLHPPRTIAADGMTVRYVAQRPVE